MTKRIGVVLLGALAAGAARAADDGSQLLSPFRINYLGYFQHGPKIALYLAPAGADKAWSLKDGAGKAVATGTSRDHVASDFASGDSFFRIDFLSFAGTGTGFQLGVEAREIAIDGNAPLVWMAWWAAYRATALLAPERSEAAAPRLLH